MSCRNKRSAPLGLGSREAAALLQLLPFHRAAKQRRRADRIVIECQEQAYWLVNRPSVSGRKRGLDASATTTFVLN